MHCPNCNLVYTDDLETITSFKTITRIGKDEKSAFEIYNMICEFCGRPIVGYYEYVIGKYDFNFVQRLKKVKFYKDSFSSYSNP